ncbi:MAG: signal recognition particle-docking protein FtsY [Acidobacteria bacterium]|nr:MAG: signal recognition particle-docking protein FtsY [Acidobacteriota bacterium]
MTSTEPRNRFGRLLLGLSRTRTEMVARIRRLAGGGRPLDDEKLEEIEEILLGADCGLSITQAVIEAIRSGAAAGGAGTATDVLELLRRELLASFPPAREIPRGRPHVILLVGVNGSGKTTTAGKLARRYVEEGQRVVLAAADTYRAAAVEQLAVWAQRAGVEMVAQKEGADPAAVVVDGLRAARARNADILLADTAGRMHTRESLMRELGKIGRVAGCEVEGAPHEVLLVMDACTGQNGLILAQRFNAALPVTGLVVTKLDGTARGGIAVALSRELKLPIRYVGVGEEAEDLLEFSPREFVDGLLAVPDPG